MDRRGVRGCRVRGSDRRQSPCERPGCGDHYRR